MALNIPVNLMSTAAYITQTHAVASAADATVIRPASDSGGSRDTSADGGGGSTEQANKVRRALLSKRLAGPVNAPVPAPDKAEARSVVTAQGTPSMPALVTRDPLNAGGSNTASGVPETPHQSEMDRYAPPDPLPTAPILLAASAYAARSTAR
jgi:hypothetical protein